MRVYLLPFMKTLLLYITQIIVEAVPVSSSTHVHLVERWLGITPSQNTMHLLHLPTLIMLLFYWRKKIIETLSSWHSFIFICIVGFFCTVITAAFYLSLQLVSFPPHVAFLGIGLTSVLLFLSDHFQNKIEKPSAIIVGTILGIVQGCSLLPGVSRLASTYAAARWCGFIPHQALWFSSAIEMPLIAAAGLKALLSHAPTEQFSWTALCIVALATALSYAFFYVTDYLFQQKKAYYFSIYLLLFVSLAVFLEYFLG
jgi:undecaprenyl-diphosphatase